MTAFTRSKYLLRKMWCSAASLNELEKVKLAQSKRKHILVAFQYFTVKTVSLNFCLTSLDDTRKHETKVW